MPLEDHALDDYTSSRDTPTALYGAARQYDDIAQGADAGTIGIWGATTWTADDEFADCITFDPDDDKDPRAVWVDEPHDDEFPPYTLNPSTQADITRRAALQASTHRRRGSAVRTNHQRQRITGLLRLALTAALRSLRHRRAPRPAIRRRPGASSSTSSADPGDAGPGKPPPGRYSYAVLDADHRGADVETQR